MSHSGLQIGEVAERAGVSIDTVRYYERRGLLPRAARTPGGFRLFGPESVGRIRFIREAQGLGFSLDEIERLLTGGGRGAAECRGVRDLLRAKLAELDLRMRAMGEFRKTLADHLAACESELKEHGASAECPVLVEIAHAGPMKAKKGKARR